MCFSRARAAGWGARGERGLRGGSCRAAGAFLARWRQGSPRPPRHRGQMASAPRGLAAPRGGLGPAVVTVAGCRAGMSLPQGRVRVVSVSCRAPGGLLRVLSGVGWVIWASQEGFQHRWPPAKALEERCRSCGDSLRGAALPGAAGEMEAASPGDEEGWSWWRSCAGLACDPCLSVSSPQVP